MDFLKSLNTDLQEKVLKEYDLIYEDRQRQKTLRNIYNITKNIIYFQKILCDIELKTDFNYIEESLKGFSLSKLKKYEKILKKNHKIHYIINSYTDKRNILVSSPNKINKLKDKYDTEYEKDIYLDILITIEYY